MGVAHLKQGKLLFDSNTLACCQYMSASCARDYTNPPKQPWPCGWETSGLCCQSGRRMANIDLGPNPTTNWNFFVFVTVSGEKPSPHQSSHIMIIDYGWSWVGSLTGCEAWKIRLIWMKDFFLAVEIGNYCSFQFAACRYLMTQIIFSTSWGQVVC